MDATQLRDRLLTVVEPVVAGAGLDLERLTVQPAGRRRVLRVVVDRDGGVTADDLAEASHQVSRALDTADAMGPAPYTLEVTSPGVDRPLKEPRHWRRVTGRLVSAPLLHARTDSATDGAEGRVGGRLVAADGEGVVLEQAAGRMRYTYDELGDGRVELEFRRPDRGEAGKTGGESAP